MAGPRRSIISVSVTSAAIATLAQTARSRRSACASVGRGASEQALETAFGENRPDPAGRAAARLAAPVLAGSGAAPHAGGCEGGAGADRRCVRRDRDWGVPGAGPAPPDRGRSGGAPSQELKEIVVPEFSDDDGMPSGRRGRKGSPVPRLARDERGVGLRASAPLSPVANGAAGRIAWWTATPST